MLQINIPKQLPWKSIGIRQYIFSLTYNCLRYILPFYHILLFFAKIQIIIQTNKSFNC